MLKLNGEFFINFILMTLIRIRSSSCAHTAAWAAAAPRLAHCRSAFRTSLFSFYLLFIFSTITSWVVSWYRMKTLK